jgi:hypothetical protein
MDNSILKLALFYSLKGSSLEADKLTFRGIILI